MANDKPTRTTAQPILPPDLVGRRGACYLRKSRADLEKERQGEFETLAKHEMELTQLSEKMGLPIDDMYRELVSGESISARTEFQRLMDGVAQKRYAYVFCHAVDRLGRGDMMEYGYIISLFQFSGTLIITPGRILDPTDQADLMQLQIEMLFSNVEYGRIKGRMKAGKEASVKQGQHVASRAPYGYDKAVTDDKKKTIVPNSDAKIVREIFDRVSQGEAKATVARDLNRRGVRTTRNKSWTPSCIARIIKNPVYYGMVRWGHERTVVTGRDGLEVQKHVEHLGDEVLVKGLHEALVSEELWKEANKRAIASPRSRADRALRNPLARVLVCKECGLTMNYALYSYKQDEGKYMYYRHKHYSKCPKLRVKMHKCDEVIAAVIGALQSLAGDYEIVLEEKDDGVKKHLERLSEMQKALKRDERTKNRLVELYTDEKMDADDYSIRVAPYEKSIAELREAIAEEESFKPKKPYRKKMQLRDAIALLADDSIPAQIRNDVLCSVVERIEYDDVDGRLQLDIYLR
ncbi:MAG: recombinase family protein [Coriobacteriales bacterium]